MELIRYWFYKLIHPTAITLRRSSGALGDNLLLSCLVREIKRVRPGKKIIIETAFPEMFRNNPNVDFIIKGKMALCYLKIKYNIQQTTKVHLIDQMISQLPYSINDHERSVDFFFSENEDLSYLALPDKYVVINPSGKMSHSSNRKEWGWDNFAELRIHFQEISFVQIGDKNTPLLPQTLDYRNRSITESARIIQNSITGVFLEGGLMHLAESVNRSCVIIYGGAVDPSVSGYDMHINISRKPHCSPCFTSHQEMDTCDTMECMKAISVDTVFNAVNELIAAAEKSGKLEVKN